MSGFQSQPQISLKTLGRVHGEMRHFLRDHDLLGVMDWFVCSQPRQSFLIQLSLPPASVKGQAWGASLSTGKWSPLFLLPGPLIAAVSNLLLGFWAVLEGVPLPHRDPGL